MSMTVTIGGVTVNATVASISIENSIDERATASFTVYDSGGSNHYTRGQTCTITDSTLGLLFNGILTDAEETKLIPGSDIMSNISAVDQRYFSDNRYFTDNEYVERASGDIVADVATKYLVPEGIVANVAIDHDNSQATMSTGTLSNTTATTQGLTLSPSGTEFSKTETSTADFNTGTLNEVVGSNNSLVLASTKAMKYTGTVAPNISSNAYLYTMIATPSLVLATGDYLSYDIFISSTSPVICGGIDVIATDGTAARDVTLVDQYGVNMHPNTDLSNYAKDTWYHREIGFNNPNTTTMIGKTTSHAVIALEGDTAGTYTIYVRNVTIKNSGGTVRATIFSTTYSKHQVVGNSAYYGYQLSVVTAYNDVGQRISPAYSISAPAIASDSLISWVTPDYVQSTANSNTYLPPVTVETSFDGGATWQACSNHAPIPSLPAGFTTTSQTITLRQTLALAGPNPEITPSISDCTVTISPSYTATKTDQHNSDSTSIDFSAGTLTNVSYVSGSGEQITGAFSAWGSGSIINVSNSVTGQTTFGTGTGNPIVSLSGGQLQIREGAPTTPNFVSSRFDFAGQWQNFILEIDIESQASGTFMPNVVYRTTGWQNVDDTYAYTLQLQATSIALYKGTNTSSGGGGSTSLGTSAGTINFQAGQIYRLKMVINGNSHQFYINNILELSVTDSSWPNAGYVGVRLWNNTTPRQSAFYTNFGIMSSAFVGTRVQPALSLNALGSVYSSLIQWNSSEPTNTDIVIEASIDGGSTWQTCTNGGSIPQLPNGTNVVGKSLLVRETLNTQNANATPTLEGITWLVVGAYNATGFRNTVSLALSPAVRCGSTSVTWNAYTPTNTSLLVSTTLNGLVYTPISTSGDPITGLLTEPDPTVDQFNVNTSANYTATFGTGGALATSWSYDLVNSRITAHNGTNALFLVNALTAIGDVDIIVDMDITDAGGVVFHYVNASNYYFVVVGDSSSAFATNVLRLYKMASGTISQLATQSITFAHGTYHRIRTTMIGSLITVYFDGVSTITYTDGSPLGVGQVGLSNFNNQSRYYQFWVQPQGVALTTQTVVTKVVMTSTDPTVSPILTDLTTAVRNPNIDTGVVIPVTGYQYQNTISALFDDLVKTNNFWWGIDVNRNLLFQNRPAVLSPFILQSSDLLAQATPKYKNTSPLYRNRQWILGGLDTTTLVTDTRMGDGFTQAWALAYAVADVTGSTPAPVITRNGVTQQVGVSGVDTGMDFYYAAGDSTIAQDPSETPLGITDALVVQYYGQIPVVVSADNTAAQTALAALQGGTGIVEAIETAAGLSKSAAQQLANARLAQYAILTTTLTFDTLRSGLAAGQQLTVFLPEHGIFDVQYLISKVTIKPRILASGVVQYVNTVEATSGPNVGSWTKLFLALGQTPQ